MAPQHNKTNGDKDLEYSFFNLLLTIVKESFSNFNETTHIFISNNGNGRKVIRTERETKSKLDLGN